MGWGGDAIKAAHMFTFSHSLDSEFWRVRTTTDVGPIIMSHFLLQNLIYANDSSLLRGPPVVLDFQLRHQGYVTGRLTGAT